MVVALSQSSSSDNASPPGAPNQESVPASSSDLIFTDSSDAFHPSLQPFLEAQNWFDGPVDDELTMAINATPAFLQANMAPPVPTGHTLRPDPGKSRIQSQPPLPWQGTSGFDTIDSGFWQPPPEQARPLQSQPSVWPVGMPVFHALDIEGHGPLPDDWAKLQNEMLGSEFGQLTSSQPF